MPYIAQPLVSTSSVKLEGVEELLSPQTVAATYGTGQLYLLYEDVLDGLPVSIVGLDTVLAAIIDKGIDPIGMSEQELLTEFNRDAYAAYIKAARTLTVYDVALSLLGGFFEEHPVTAPDEESIPHFADLRKLGGIARATGNAGALLFVRAAEGGELDDVTATENAALFELWRPSVSYEVGQIRRYGDCLYKCVSAHTSQEGWFPSSTTASLWSKIGDPSDPFPPWAQPIGAHDAYQIGDQVSYGGKHWRSSAAGNVWIPGVFGWDKLN